MVINLWELQAIWAEKMQQVYRRNHTKQCKLLMSFNEWEQAHKEFKKKKRTFAWSIMYLNEWKQFHRQFLLSLQRFFLLRCFSVLSAILSSKPFRIRCFVKSLMATSIYFLMKYNWKKKTWKVFFGCHIFGAQTGIPVTPLSDFEISSLFLAFGLKK